MALVPVDLAEAIRTAMGFEGAVSPELVGWATGVICEIQTGVVSHAVVTGCGPGCLMCGAATCGVIVCVCGEPMAQGIIENSSGQYGFISPELQKYATAVAAHITCCGMVCFASGTITGPAIPCSPFVGCGACGTIVCLCGPALAQQIADAVGYGEVSDPLCKKATAMVDYITLNAEVIYCGTVLGCITGCVLVGGVGTCGMIL